jgi:5-methylcytosine-specific restriction endonuclease McrA
MGRSFKRTPPNPAAARPKVKTDQCPPARVNPTVPERYKVQFTATAEYVRLVEEAQALLSHAAPRATLDEIHLRALRSFVALLRKQKYATADVPSRQTQPEVAVAPLRSQSETEATELEITPSHEDVSVPHPRRRRRGRHIPAAVRRAVFNRDGQQCTHVEPGGRRCAETHRLEFHHLEPFAKGGEHTAANLALRCAAHNALAAEDDFGRELIERAKASRP